MVSNLPDRPMVGLAQNYRDAISLLGEARDYAVSSVAADDETADQFELLQANTKAMEVTACLADIVAWLMSQRAVEAGEIARDQVREDRHRLGRCPLREPTSGDAVRLPSRLERLVRLTLKLYNRLDRLDRLLDGNLAKTPFA